MSSKKKKPLIITSDNNMQDKNGVVEIWVNLFNEEAAKEFRMAVHAQVKQFDDDRKPIIVYIDSYGGAVDSLMVMLETLDSVPNPVITACIGKAMSCGAVLLSHGDIRFCGQHSRVMVHEVSSAAWGDVHDMENDAKESARINRYVMGLLAKNCGVEGGYQGLRKMIKDHDGRELWMDAKAAIKFGIADNIGMPTVDSELKYGISVFKKDLHKDE